MRQHKVVNIAALNGSVNIAVLNGSVNIAVLNTFNKCYLDIIESQMCQLSQKRVYHADTNVCFISNV